MFPVNIHFADFDASDKYFALDIEAVAERAGAGHLHDLPIAMHKDLDECM